MAKINGSGTTLWVKSAGSSVLDYGEAVHVDGSGNVYTGGKINTNSFVTKYNSSGVISWTVDLFGNTVVRRINAFANELLINDYQVGFKMVSTADGSVINSDSLVGNYTTGKVSIRDVATAGSGFVFGTMVSCGSVNIENLTLTSSCPNACNVCFNFGDLGMVRNGGTPPLAVSQPIHDFYDGLTSATDKSVFNIYPNPATDEVNIVFDQPVSSLHLNMYDYLGKRVWSQQMMEGSTTMSIKLDDNRFGNGVYYISAISNGTVLTQLLMITR